MLFFRRLFTIQPLGSSALSAATYVPMVMVARGLGFLRLLLIARILGEAGKAQFGLYNPALYLINPLVALVMFGAADVAERYVSTIEREGHAALRRWLLGQYLRLLLKALLAAAMLIAASPWVSRFVWNQVHIPLVAACALTVVLLAFYQHLAAVLRGLRAYSAAAGMEVLGALLLLILSALAAFKQDATWLMAAYAVSLLLLVLIYGGLLWRDLASDAILIAPAAAGAPPQPRHITRFAAWALVRMLLVMLFGFLSFWGVRYLADALAATTSPDQPPSLVQTADFSLPYTVAQLLGYLAVTLWASSYAIAARAWSHRQVRRATVQLFRTGRFGAAGLALLAAAILLTRGIFEHLFPTYAVALENLLPPLLATFMLYAMVSFFSTYADLREQPQRGAALWGTAVLLQIAGILWARLAHASIDPKSFIVLLSAASLAAALLFIAPPLLCRPFRFTATGIPLVLVSLASATLFCPSWVVDWIAVPALLGSVLLLLIMGLIIRRADHRAFGRWWFGHR